MKSRTASGRGVRSASRLHKRALGLAEVEAAPAIDYDRLALLHELEVHQEELKTQNEALREARAEAEAGREQYTELFDFSPVPYVLLGRDEAIREINHAGAELLGRARSVLSGQPLAALTRVADRSALARILARALEHDLVGGEIRETCEIVLERPSGHFHAKLTVTALGREASRVALIALEDVTERRAAEALSQKATQALRVADARKDDFLAMLAHELRNPLAPVRSGLFVLRKAAPGSEKALRAREIIERQVAHFTRLIDDLLDVSRIARGKIVLKREPVDLTELLKRTVEDRRAEFEASGLRLEGDPEGRTRSPGIWIDADAVRLVQTVSNLLGNAEKFTPRGGTVKVSLAVEEGRAALRVRDNGAGMAAEELPFIFEPFTQGPQAVDRGRGGLGLGLAMSKGLIELHGGTILVRSEGRGCGTEVTVTLPLIAAPPQAPAPEEPAASAARRVLVVEDNVDAAEMLQDALEAIGHVVRIAHDGAEGLDIALALRPEVVLCDIGLPGLDGYEVARALRREAAFDGTLLVALSGYARKTDIERSRRAGFDVHLAKPANLDDLERLLADPERARSGEWAVSGHPLHRPE